MTHTHIHMHREEHTVFVAKVSASLDIQIIGGEDGDTLRGGTWWMMGASAGGGQVALCGRAAETMSFGDRLRNWL